MVLIFLQWIEQLSMTKNYWIKNANTAKVERPEQTMIKLDMGKSKGP